MLAEERKVNNLSQIQKLLPFSLIEYNIKQQVMSKQKEVPQYNQIKQESYVQLYLNKIQPKHDQKARNNNAQLRSLEWNTIINQEVENSSCDSEVSIEEDILQEHLTVINEKVASYCLFLDSNSKNSKKDDRKHQNLKNISLQQYLAQTISHLFPHSPLFHLNFLTYLQKEGAFRNYLRHIYYTLPFKTVEKIIKLLLLIWNLYLPCTIMTLSQAEVHQMAVVVTKNLWKKHRVASETLGNCDRSKQSAQYRFYFVLAMTTLLVIQKIFKNPFYGSLGSQSQEEDEGQTATRKCGRKFIKMTVDVQ